MNEILTIVNREGESVSKVSAGVLSEDAFICEGECFVVHLVWMTMTLPDSSTMNSMS